MINYSFLPRPLFRRFVSSTGVIAAVLYYLLVVWKLTSYPRQLLMIVAALFFVSGIYLFVMFVLDNLERLATKRAENEALYGRQRVSAILVSLFVAVLLTMNMFVDVTEVVSWKAFYAVLSFISLAGIMYFVQEWTMILWNKSKSRLKAVLPGCISVGVGIVAAMAIHYICTDLM